MAQAARWLVLTILFVASCSSSGVPQQDRVEGSEVMTEQCADRTYSFRTVEGARLHFRLEGPRSGSTTARPIVVLHGAYANHCDPAYAFLPQLAENRQVLFVDRPGLGRSERPADGYDPCVQARLIRTLAGELELERPIVLGHSFGGAVALGYGLDTVDRPDDPAAASGLLLLAPVSHPWPGGVSWWNSVSETPGIGFLFRRAVVPLVGPAMVRGAVSAPFLPDDYIVKTGPDQFLEARIFRNNARDLTKLKPIIRQMAPRYGALDMPIEIRAGSADTTVYTDIHARALAEEAPNANLEVFEGVGHLIHYERTDEVLAALATLDARVK